MNSAYLALEITCSDYKVTIPDRVHSSFFLLFWFPLIFFDEEWHFGKYVM